jgi:hypothetical protein
MKKAKKQHKTTAKAPTNMAAAYKEVAQHYVATEMWDAVDRCIYMHGKEPTSSNHHGAMQLAAGQIDRIDSLTDALRKAMDHYGDLTIKDMPYHKDLEEVIDDIYFESANEVVDMYLDEGDKYLKDSKTPICPDCGGIHDDHDNDFDDEEMPTECDACGSEPANPEDLKWYSGLPGLSEEGFHGETLCQSCLSEKPLLFSVAYSTNGPMRLVSKDHIFERQEKAIAAAKALATLNKGRQFMVWATKGNMGMPRFMEDAPLTIPHPEALERANVMREEMSKAIEDELIRGCKDLVAKEKSAKAVKPEEKSGTFAQLAMFGGAMLGAGLATAAMSGSPGVRVSDVSTSDVIEEVVEAAKEISK